MNKYHNIKKMVEISEPIWNDGTNNMVVDLAVSYSTNKPFMINNDCEFINMASCSYLGFDTHSEILKGATDAIYKVGSLHLTTPRYKMFVTMLSEVESKLTRFYKNDAMSYISCSAASSAFLPLYSSGVLSGNIPPFMIFDKNAHFSMNHIKPICGDSTEVVTCAHNDLNYVEDMCKKKAKVAYITEGVFSIAGVSPVSELSILQDKYGLFIYYDDSHGFSIIGDMGEGYVLEQVGGILNENTVVVASLAKAFGACGGVLLAGNKAFKGKLIRYGNSWSQYINSAGLGAILASLKLHSTNELTIRQKKWQDNLQFIDSQLPYLKNYGTISPTRTLLLRSDQETIRIAKAMFNLGYYVSPVFFPTVSKTDCGLRFMPRADMSMEQLKDFVKTLKHFIY